MPNSPIFFVYIRAGVAWTVSADRTALGFVVGRAIAEKINAQIAQIARPVRKSGRAHSPSGGQRGDVNEDGHGVFPHTTSLERHTLDPRSAEKDVSTKVSGDDSRSRRFPIARRRRRKAGGRPLARGSGSPVRRTTGSLCPRWPRHPRGHKRLQDHEAPPQRGLAVRGTGASGPGPEPRRLLRGDHPGLQRGPRAVSLRHHQHEVPPRPARNDSRLRRVHRCNRASGPHDPER